MGILGIFDRTSPTIRRNQLAAATPASPTTLQPLKGLDVQPVEVSTQGLTPSVAMFATAVTERINETIRDWAGAQPNMSGANQIVTPYGVAAFRHTMAEFARELLTGIHDRRWIDLEAESPTAALRSHVVRMLQASMQGLLDENKLTEAVGNAIDTYFRSNRQAEHLLTLAYESLRLKDGIGNLAAYMFEGTLEVGRNKVTSLRAIRINHGGCSANHVNFEYIPTNEAIAAIDQGSTHGTFVNDQKLTPNRSQHLQPGDLVTLGLGAEADAIAAVIMPKVASRAIMLTELLHGNEMCVAGVIENLQKIAAASQSDAGPQAVILDRSNLPLLAPELIGTRIVRNSGAWLAYIPQAHTPMTYTSGEQVQLDAMGGLKYTITLP